MASASSIFKIPSTKYPRLNLIPSVTLWVSKKIIYFFSIKITFPINWNWVNNTCSFDWGLILFWKSETTDFLATKTRTFFESLALTEWAEVQSAVAIWRSSTLKPVETEDSGSASSGGRVHPTSRFRRVRQVFLEKTKTLHVSF